MAKSDVTRIYVGKIPVGIIGLKPLMGKMAETHADKSDEEVCSFMLAELGRDNYIPREAGQDYARALLGEFKKYLGKPFGEVAPVGLSIKVLGVGCPQCHGLAQLVMEVLTELNLPAEVDQVSDLKEIAGYGVAGTPALVIGGRVMAVGGVPARERVKKWLVGAAASS